VEILHDAVERQGHAESGLDPRAQLLFNGYIDGRRTIALAQPSEWSEPGIELAARGLAMIHRTLATLGRASDLSAGDRIRRAFEAANADLVDHLRSQSGHDLDGRIGVGAAVVQVDGSVATIGLVPPSQVLVWQDGRLTWCPTRESWTGHQPGLIGSPLGWSSEPQSTVVATSVNQRDELVLTTDTLARHLAEVSASELKSSDAVCARITALGLAESVDPAPLMAVATRPIAPTATGSIIGASRQTLVQIEARLKSAWTAARAQPQSGPEAG
jgi:hypothetical protein